jgi:hypothetical protein
MGSGDVSQGEEPEGTTFRSVDTPLMVKGYNSLSGSEEAEKNVDAIKKDNGDLRRMTMELLYRHGQLKGPEIGATFGIDYSSVSQERKLLRGGISKDSELDALFLTLN